MSKKSFLIIFGLSVMVTYGVAVVDFVLNITSGKIGIPFGFSSLSLMGSSTDYTVFFLDIACWFVIIWIIWKVISYFSGRVGQ